MIVFTDLDGTLLDHETYSAEAARPALDRLRILGVPVIPATSKTAAELGPLMRELGLSGPAIVENGAGLMLNGSGDSERSDYTAIRAALEALPGSLGAQFTGFGDLTDAEVSALTGLGPDAARRARNRQFSEPGLFSGSADEQDAFVAALSAAGISAVAGGRFLTLSRGASKADRMAEVIARLGATPPVIALGDAPNDITLLQAADTGIVVSNPAHAPLPELAGEREGRIRRTLLPGPAGWNAAMLDIIGRTAEP
ncbi:MAG: HAD-IIB family hydrolase [Notoacmeibacter sp.]|nr:HAD-IIB family hydrolase [Notoacmeibacter sp.]MCC0033546.1 HAD-IIB family hydrolase [Brucellaceae bacterium]